MGSWVSGSFGYGIVVPNGDEDEFEFNTKPDSFLAGYTDEDGTIDWWEVGEEMGRRFGLTFDFPSVHDYADSMVLFASELGSLQIVKTFTDDEFAMFKAIPRDKVDALSRAADLLGIPFDAKWILVTSYG